MQSWLIRGNESPTNSTRILRGFDNVAHSRKKLIGDGSINNSMIEAQPKYANLPNRDRIIDHDGALLDHAHAEDRNLRLIDNRSPGPTAKCSRIRNSEGPAL